MEKLFLSIKVLLIGLISFMAIEATSCDYTFKLYDSYGDGWNGGTLTILVNGVAVATGLTLQNGTGPYIHTISVAGGDVISTVYTAGSWPEENYYELYDSHMQFVVRDGCTNYSCQPQGGFLANAVCPDKDIGAISLVTPATGCNLGTSEVISIAVKNFGNLQTDTIYVSYSIDGGLTFINDTLYQAFYPGDTIIHIFFQTADLSQPGIHNIIITATCPGDQYIGNDTIIFQTTNLPLITTYPYFESFESGAGGWYSGGANSSWALGAPNYTVINQAATGSNAWATNLTGPYNDNEASWVASPCFDLTGMANPVFEMKIWYETDWYDGGAVQYSTDGVNWFDLGAYNDPTNWYNSDWIEGLIPFGWPYEGWRGSSYGYVTVSHFLPPHLAGAPVVRFRIVFGATSWHYGYYDGIAFDDVRIYEPPPMSYSSGLVFQNNTNVLGKGMKNQEVIGIRIETASSTNPLIVNQISFNTTGTTNSTDIDSAKVWYSGADSTLSTMYQYGGAVKPMSPFTFSGNQTLLEGANFFWLTYDVSNVAATGNFLDAVVDSIQIGSVWYVPSNNNPTGNRQILPAMNGVYTVNPSGGGNYLSINEAVTDLNNRGVSGPVTIDIMPGVYNEKITLHQIYGASSSNPVTFKSVTNDSTAVTIQDLSTQYDQNWVIRFLNAEYIILKHLHVKPLSNNYGRAIVFDGIVNNNIEILNCFIEGAQNVQYYDTYMSLIYSESTTEKLKISNNRLDNSSIGIMLFNWYSIAGETEISHNYLNNQYARGIEMEFQNSPLIHGNTIISGLNYDQYRGISAYDFRDSFRITSNKISMANTGQGIRMTWSAGSINTPGFIANNFVAAKPVSSNSLHGIFIAYTERVQAVYNSVNIYGGQSVNNSAFMSEGSNNSLGIYNNIFCNTTQGNSIIITNSASVNSDFNNFYYTGPNIGQLNNNIITDLTAWQSASGYDLNSHNHYPTFFSDTDLHTYSSLINAKGTPVTGIYDDIDGDIRHILTPDIGADEFDLPAQEASFEGFISPVDGCGLGLEDITIRIANNGTATINGGLTAYYQIAGAAVQSEVVTTTILPGDTLDFIFSNKPDLSVMSADSTFEIFSYVSLINDPLQFNDSGSTTVWSGWVPSVPVPQNTTVNYGNSAVLSVSGPGSKLWFEDPSDTTSFHLGDTLITGPLFDTTTYYVSAGGSGGQISNDLTTTFSSNNGSAGNMFNITAHKEITIDSFYVNCSSSGPMEVWYRPGSYIGFQSTQSGWTKLGDAWVNSAGSNNPTVLPVGGLTIPAGETYGIYITFADGYSGIRYTNGTGYNETYVNDDLTLVALHGGGYFNTTITPRVWNGRLFYRAGSGSFLCTSQQTPVTALVTAFPGVDAGISAIVNPPGQIQAGADEPVTVQLHNYGTNTLQSVTINWKINNTTQPAFLWTGNLPHGTSTIVTLDTISFPGGMSCISAWTSQPNNLPDNFSVNDSSSTCFSVCLAGVYTIGPSSSGSYDFNSFTDAVAVLQAGGICGNVFFDVYPGTYNEQITINTIPGADQNNTVTFRGVTSDSTDAVVQFASNTTANNFVVRLNQSSHITFRYITFSATGTSYGCVFEFMDNSSNNKITNCVIQTSTTSTSSNFTPVYSTANGPSNNISITNNHITGGYYGIYWYGSNSNRKTNINISNNLISEFYYSGIYAYYTDSFTIASNLIINRTNSSTLYPVYIGYSSGPGVITKNRIHTTSSSTNYGLYLAYCQGTFQKSFLISNNFITQQGNLTGTAYGIYNNGNYYVNYYNNSVLMNGGSVTGGRAFMNSGGGNINVINNIFSNFNYGYAYYISSTWAIENSDYNNHYTNGVNLAYYNQNIQSLNNLQISSGKDLNSHDIAPPFMSSENLMLTNTSLSGKATPLSLVPDDIFGRQRTVTPTIGAHEIPLIPEDAGVQAFITPTSASQPTEGDIIPVEVVVENFGLDTLTTFNIDFMVNGVFSGTATYTGTLPPAGTDTVVLPSYITPPGNVLICAFTVLPGDSNRFNDTLCINYYAFSNIDAELSRIFPVTEGCGLGFDTVKIEIVNVATAPVPAGFTASYQLGNNVAIYETVNSSIAVNDTLVYAFNTLVDLSTTTDTTYHLTAWLTVPDDNINNNDTSSINIISLAVPAPPAVTSPVSTPFGTSTVLDANSTLHTQWYSSLTSSVPLGTGSIFHTPVLYDTTVFFVETFFGSPSQEFIIGNASTQNSTTSYPTPYGNWYWGNKEQYLVRASELTAASIIPGEISSIAFDVISPRGTPLQNFTIKIGQTSQVEMTNNFVTSGMTTVYYSAAYTDLAGWNVHDFSTPFNWDGTSNIVVEVCFNNNSYTSNGVVSLASPGYNSTVRYASDATGVCNQTSGSTSNQRPVMKLKSTTLGCKSQRVPVVVNVTNIPPLGKPHVTPDSIDVLLTDCNGSDTRNIRIKNIGTAALQYTTFGGPHIVDTTSTKYFNSSSYPDTTTHLFTTIPPSVDSLFLEITINGYYSSSSNYASLIIDGNFIEIIPDGDVPNGTDVTVNYSFGGQQLESWLSDGEIEVRIGNSQYVYPWYGTRMHKVRAYTKPAPWVSLIQTTGSIAVGDSTDLTVQVSAAGLTDGYHYATIPIEFNHPGYPFVKVPVSLHLQGQPNISSAPCLTFNPIFQYDTTTDSIVIFNTGCSELTINNILNSDTTFSPQITQAVIPPFDSLVLKVTFSPIIAQTYFDTLVIKSNIADHKVCLNGIGLSPPILSLNLDTVDITVINCADSAILPLTITNPGNAPLTWNATFGASIEDQFNNTLNPELWQSNTGVVSGACGSYSGTAALYFNNSGTREAVTKPLNTVGGGNISFYLKIGSGSSPCELADFGEDIKLQYSINGGLSWTDINTYYAGGYTTFTYITEAIPVIAQTNSTQFRWMQVSHSGAGYDNWSIDDVSISNSASFAYITPDTGTVAPLGSQIANIKVYTQGLTAGVYSGSLVFNSNDPVNPTKTVPYHLTLIGAPETDIQLSGCLIHDTTLNGGISHDSLIIANIGCDTLFILSAYTSTQHFGITSSPSHILPFDQGTIIVSFNPKVTGNLTDTIDLQTNDGNHYICLEGYAQPAPELVLSQNILTANIINCNDSLLVPLQVINQGQGDLYFNVSTDNSGSPWLTLDTSNLTLQNYYLPNSIIGGQNIAPYATVTASSCNNSPCSAFNDQNYGTCGTQQVWVSTSSPPSLTPHANYIDFTWPSQVSIEGLTIYHGEATTRLLTGATLYRWDGSNWISFYTFSNLPMQCENSISFPMVTTEKLRITSFQMTGSGQQSNPNFREIEVHQVSKAYHVAPNSYSTLNFMVNALGMNSGSYTTDIVVYSNDPLKPLDTVECTMIIIGAPETRFSHISGCIDMDTVIQGFSVSDTLTIFNDGCDTLKIFSISNSLTQFSLSSTTASILPGNSFDLIISFSPDASIPFNDTLIFNTNDGIYNICLNAVGTDAPVISFNPASLSYSFTNCNDSITLPVTIYNTGIGDLRFSITNLLGSEYNQTSTKYYTTTGATTNHNFPGVPLTSDSMTVILTINGDFDDASEYCWLYIEGTNIGVVQDWNQSNGTNIVNQYTFSGAQLGSWLADGELNISVVNSNAVDHWSGLVSMHKVDVHIHGVPWITIDNTSDTVVSGDSTVLMVSMNTSQLNSGIYYTDLTINSNDPANQNIQIPCTMTINGSANISFSDACLHFGQVMQHSSAKDTLVITNTGCSNLIISSVYTTLPHFTLSSSYITLQPGQEYNLIVTFSPSVVGQLSDNITFVTNIGNHTVCLTGHSVDASILSVSPSSFTKTINSCNDTISDILQIQNLGTGDLTYQVYGGRGLSGDSTVLIIRDSDPWSVDIAQYLFNNFGVTADVISSSQILAANFNIYDIIITVGNQTNTYYNSISSQIAKFSNFAESGGILLHMLANYQVNTMTIAGNATYVYGNPESQNIIGEPGHPVVQGMSNPLNGSNASISYFTNLPANARVITRTNVTSLPTTIEYEIGSGLVLATGMMWEYHSSMSSYNISQMMHNAFEYALATIGTSPSWLSFVYTADTVFGVGSTTITVEFNSTGIPNGVHHSNIIVYSNDPVNPQIIVPCTLTVNGAAQIATSSACIVFDTVIQGATLNKSFTIYNTGCDNLVINSVTSSSSEYVINGIVSNIPAGDSSIITVSFTPQTTGNRNGNMFINTNIGTTQVCLEGFGINPPVVSVSPSSFNVVLNGCNDTITQTLNLSNTGAGQAVFHILGLYGSDIDQTSHIPFVTNGATTTHTFSNLPPNIDTLIVEVTLSGDFDQANEYANLIIEGTAIGMIDDGNITAGTPYTDYFGFGGSQLSNWLSDGQLVIDIQNASTVDHWSGLNSYHNVRIKVNGNYWMNLSSLSDTILSNSSEQVTVTFFSTNVNAGTHFFNMLIGSNDPGNAQVSVPCTLTVNGAAAWAIGQTCLDFDSTMIGASDSKTLTISNTGCDTLKITNIQSNVASIVPALTSAYIMPHDTLSIPVVFTPVASGGISGSLTVTSNIGQTTLCLNAAGLPAPAISIDQTTLISNLACEVTETKDIIIRNNGQANLNLQISPNGNYFITLSGNSATIIPGDSVIITFSFDKTGLSIGTYTAQFTVSSNDPLNASVIIACTLEIPNMLSPVDLGPDLDLCMNQTATINAGSGYLSYLWDDLSTDSIRSFTTSGTYFINVTDSNNCSSSDTISIIFHPNPVVYAGSDTIICAGAGIIRNANASGTIQTGKSVQIGTSSSYSSTNYITPFSTNYKSARRQIIFRQNEMEQNGFKRGWINSIQMNIGAVGDPSTLSDFNISIGTTTINSLSSSFITNLNNVYSVSLQNLQSGWNTFIFNTPFFYDGTENIVIEMCFTNNTNNINSSIQYHTATFSGAHRYNYSFNTSQNGCSLTGGFTSASRPNIRFDGNVDEGTYFWTGPGNIVYNTPVLKIDPVASQHTGFYYLTVDNGAGCTSTDAFNLSLAPLPAVSAGQDTFIYLGSSYTLEGNVSGGLPPYNYLWAPGSTLNDSTLLQPIATPNTTTTYTLTATGANGCSNSSQMTLTVIPLYNINGTLTYNNAAYTPLSNTKVYLLNSAFAPIDSVTTDISGLFSFYFYPPGTYYLDAFTDKPWGGVNSTDALVVQRHVINLNPLSGLRLTGADVNNSNTVSSVDALLILRRTLGLDSLFDKPDWVFDKPLIHIINSNVTKNFQALATGDVNGSYLPATLRQKPAVEVMQKGYESAKGGIYRIPVRTVESIFIGAVTLLFDLPSQDISVESINSPLDGLMYNIHQGKLIIVWSDENGHYLNAGEELFTIRLKSDNNSMKPFWFYPHILSEMADVYANILDPAVLSAPGITADEEAGINNLSVYNRPNPFSERTTFICNLPEDGFLEIELFDMLGKSFSVLNEVTAKKGTHHFDFESLNLPSGIYHYRVTLRSKDMLYRTNKSLVIVK